MKKQKFLIDENIHIRLSDYLHLRGYKAIRAPKGMTDDAIISFAKRKSLIFITLDRDFANIDLHHPRNTRGIIVLIIHPPTLENLIIALRHLLANVPSQNFNGKLFLVDKNHIEIISK